VFSAVAEMSLPPCSQVRASGTPPSPVSLSAGAGDFAFCFFQPSLPGVPAEPGQKGGLFQGDVTSCGICHPRLQWGRGKTDGSLAPVTVFAPDGHGDWHSGS